MKNSRRQIGKNCRPPAPNENGSWADTALLSKMESLAGLQRDVDRGFYAVDYIY